MANTTNDTTDTTITGRKASALPIPPAGLSESYAHNYRILAATAERLRNGREDDVDGLVDHFRMAMGAYRACLSRLDAVQAEIDAELDLLAPEPV